MKFIKSVVQEKKLKLQAKRALKDAGQGVKNAVAVFNKVQTGLP